MAIAQTGARSLFGEAPEDPFAPDALVVAATPLDSFIAILALIDRTVLPRVVTIEGTAAPVSLDIGRQALSLLPRQQNTYAIDQTLLLEAPQAYRSLNKRVPAARKAMDELRPARRAILRGAVRALWALAGAGGTRYQVSAATTVETGGISFSALELYQAARDQFAPGGNGAAAAFYEIMMPRAQGGWHATRSGWVHDIPETGDARADLRKLVEIGHAARHYAGWIETMDALKGPSLSFLSGTGHKVIRCIAVDDSNIALVNLSPTAWSGALQSWDTIRANAS